jgi:hypothetical protein
MKKIVLSIVIIASSIITVAQNTAKDIFSKPDMVWFGLNFSEAKMVGNFAQVGEAGESSSKELRDKWMPSWNGLIIGEPQNFKFAETYEKDNIITDINSTEKMNKAINLGSLTQDEMFSFSDPQKAVKNVVSKLQANEKKEGLGLVYVVESFNKNTQIATIYVTIFDIATKNVLITEKIEGKGAGIGLRNYWAGAVKVITKEVKANYYKNWKKTYGK